MQLKLDTNRKYESEREIDKKVSIATEDFTFQEMETLFSIFGFDANQKGKTSGSRILFVNETAKKSYSLHKPHPTNVIKPYVMKQILDFLKEENFIK